MKKLRFGDLVRHSGRPEVLTLWAAPGRNRELQRAIQEHRILTVQQRNVGTRTDAAEIGFRQRSDGLYLVFPRPLDGPDGRAVIGINYELLEPVAPPDRARVEASRPALVPPISRKRPVPRRRFCVTIRSQVRQEVEVEAASSKEARVRAMEEVARMTVPEADWRRSVLRVVAKKRT